MALNVTTKSGNELLGILDRLATLCEEDLARYPEGEPLHEMVQGQLSGYRSALRQVRTMLPHVEIDAALDPEPVKKAIRDWVAA